MSPEEELVLSLSRLDLSGEEKGEIEGFLSKHPASIDFSKALKLADINLVSPLLYRNMKEFRDVPTQFMGALKKAYLATFHQNVLHSRETLRLIGMLRGAGVEAIPVKGSLAADIIMGDFGVYPTGDVDLLVRPADLEKTKKILADEGFCEVMEFSERDLRESSYHLILGNGSYLVEVHWNLVKWAFEADPEFWWEGMRREQYEGQEISFLSPERYLLYAIFHLFTHRFRPLKFALLVSGLARKYRHELDWERLLSDAGRIRMERLTLFTLRLLHEILGTDIPDYLARKRILGYSLLKRNILRGFFPEATRSYVRLALFTTLLDTPLDTARVLLRRLFPPASEIRLRYNLPMESKRVYLYYLANPVLMMFRKR